MHSSSLFLGTSVLVLALLSGTATAAPTGNCEYVKTTGDCEGNQRWKCGRNPENPSSLGLTIWQKAETCDTVTVNGKSMAGHCQTDLFPYSLYYTKESTGADQPAGVMTLGSTCVPNDPGYAQPNVACDTKTMAMKCSPDGKASWWCRTKPEGGDFWLWNKPCAVECKEGPDAAGRTMAGCY